MDRKQIKKQLGTMSDEDTIKEFALKYAEKEILEEKEEAERQVEKFIEEIKTNPKLTEMIDRKIDSRMNLFRRKISREMRLEFDNLKKQWQENYRKS